MKILCSKSINMEKQQPGMLYFSSRNGLIRIDIFKIVYFESDGNYTHIVTTNKLKTCLCKNLTHIEGALATQLGEQANCFIRIGKRFIVNTPFIYHVDLQKQRLILTDYNLFTFQLPISKDALKTVKDIIIQHKL